MTLTSIQLFVIIVSIALAINLTTILYFHRLTVTPRTSRPNHEEEEEEEQSIIPSVSWWLKFNRPPVATTEASGSATTTQTTTKNNGESMLSNNPILDILLKSGEIPKSTTNNNNEELLLMKYRQLILPTMNDFTSMYGKSSKIIGLDTCHKFQNQISPLESIVGPAGVFNTGTNLISKLMKKHCMIQERSKKYDDGQVPQEENARGDIYYSQLLKSADINSDDEIAWGTRTGMVTDVPWGKHGPPHWRNDDKYKPEEFKVNKIRPRVENYQVFPIVMVKDPYSWMGSMCRNSYSARWLPSPHSCINLDEEYDTYPSVHGMKKTVHNEMVHKKPPNNLRFSSPEKLKKKRNRKGLKVEYLQSGEHSYRMMEYKNLLDWWNSFYSGYLNATFPRLIIRYEDLLLYSDEIIPQICNCVGGKLINAENGVNIFKDSAKDSRVYGHTSNLVDSLIRYGSRKERIKHCSNGDLLYANNTLDKNLMNIFQYSYPSFEYEKVQMFQIQQP